jgi:hypothetical protein
MTESKTISWHDGHISAEEEGGVVRTQGGQGVELIISEDDITLVGDEDPVNSLQGWMSVLITPSIETAIEVYFLQRSIVKKMVKLTH